MPHGAGSFRCVYGTFAAAEHDAIITASLGLALGLAGAFLLIDGMA